MIATETSDGVNTHFAFRILSSIPSHKKEEAMYPAIETAKSDAAFHSNVARASCDVLSVLLLSEDKKLGLFLIQGTDTAELICQKTNLCKMFQSLHLEKCIKKAGPVRHGAVIGHENCFVICNVGPRLAVTSSVPVVAYLANGTVPRVMTASWQSILSSESPAQAKAVATGGCE